MNFSEVTSMRENSDTCLPVLQKNNEWLQTEEGKDYNHKWRIISQHQTESEGKILSRDNVGCCYYLDKIFFLIFWDFVCVLVYLFVFRRKRKRNPGEQVENKITRLARITFLIQTWWNNPQLSFCSCFGSIYRFWFAYVKIKKSK